jgi:hypothetical protein
MNIHVPTLRTCTLHTVDCCGNIEIILGESWVESAWEYNWINLVLCDLISIGVSSKTQKIWCSVDYTFWHGLYFLLVIQCLFCAIHIFRIIIYVKHNWIEVLVGTHKPQLFYPNQWILKLYLCSLFVLDTGKVDLIMNVVERPNGGFSAGGGISSGWVVLT